MNCSNEEYRIAKVCHEANRAYCETIGDLSQPIWEKAPEWQQESAIKGVRLHLSGSHSPQASHDSWMKQKLNDGWKYGPVKNPETKEHPCIVSYDQLPEDQRRKDFLFKNIVEAFKSPTPSEHDIAASSGETPQSGSVVEVRE